MCDLRGRIKSENRQSDDEIRGARRLGARTGRSRRRLPKRRSSLEEDSPLANATLTEFVERALRVGASRPQIRAALAAAGWSEAQIDDGLRAYADSPFPVPVPRPRSQASARDAFLYLLAFTMLYLSVMHLGSLLFQFVNIALHDALEDGPRRNAGVAVRWAIAVLVVAWPLFIFTSRTIRREVLQDVRRRSSAVRRWLTYLTLFLTASVLVGDFITLFFSLLSFDTSLRFLLKALIVVVIAGAVFAYYLASLREDDAALRR